MSDAFHARFTCGNVVRRLVLASLLALAPFAFAASDDAVIYPTGAARASEVPVPAAPPSANGSLLAAAAVLAGVGGWFAWRHVRTRPALRQGRALEITETRPLGNRQFLVVATYGSNSYLLGVCPGSISLLAPLNTNGAPANATVDRTS